MSNQQKSFLIYKDSLSILKKLSKDQIADLFLAIADYQLNGVQPEDNFVSIIFDPFLNQFKRDEEKFQAICNRNRANGRAGGRPKKPTGLNNNPKNPVGYLETQNNPEEPKKADSDSDSDIELLDNPIVLSNNSKNINSNEFIKKSDTEEKFQQLWLKYIPIKTKDGAVGKGSTKTARIAFEKALKKFPFEKIINAVEPYLEQCRANNRFTKQVSTWLNQECFNDDFDEACIMAVGSSKQAEQDEHERKRQALRDHYAKQEQEVENA